MKKIQLGGHIKGRDIKGYALVDDKDFESLNKYKWFIHAGYVARKSNYKTISMHREIMQTPKGLLTDHINHNPLDNRRLNLRVCTFSQNNMNRRKYGEFSSTFKGVYWSRASKRWGVKIENNHIGYFDKELHAAMAYDLNAIELFTDFADLNFPFSF